MKIGFIGLGNVGGKLANSLLRNKFDLTVRDVEKNLTNDFKSKGADRIVFELHSLLSNMGFKHWEVVWEPQEVLP